MTGGIEHGGALDLAVARHGGRREDWLDLSTGINPDFPPLPDIPAEAWTRLPEASDLADALAAARTFYGVPDGAGIVAAPGTQALIQLLPELAPRGPVAIVSPTYGEHAHCFARAGREVVEVPGIDALPAGCAVAVAVNPNNPDGSILLAEALVEAAGTLRARGGMLVVDEAFAEAGDAESMVPAAAGGGLVVLRSFGKFFGLAGLRLGFAVAEPDLARRIADRLGPWAVSGPALHVASVTLGDAGRIAEIRRRMAENATRLEAVLAGNGLAVAGRTRLFALVEDARAQRIYEELCRRHILVRRFGDRPHWLRFGLPGSDAARSRLDAALRAATGR